MTSGYQDELRARFGLDVDPGGEAPDDPWLRQVLMRRTHRRYSDRPVPDALVRLLLAAAFSASSKSDFQQASALWLRDHDRRDRLASLFPDMPGSAMRRCFSSFSAMRGGSTGSANCAANRGQRRARRVFQCDGGRGAGDADLHPGRRDGRARHLPDQRAAQPHRRNRRHSRTARQGVPGCGALSQLPGAARLYQHAPAAGGDRAYRPLRRFRAGRGGGRLRPAARRAPFDQGPRARARKVRGRRVYGWSEDKVRQAATPEGAGFASWLKAHGFTLDEP